MIGSDDLSLFRYVETPEEAFACLKQELGRELERVTPAFAKSVRPCCEPGEPCARHGAEGCHDAAQARRDS